MLFHVECPDCILQPTDCTRIAFFACALLLYGMSVSLASLAQSAKTCARQMLRRLLCLDLDPNDLEVIRGDAPDSTGHLSGSRQILAAVLLPTFLLSLRKSCARQQYGTQRPPWLHIGRR